MSSRLRIFILLFLPFYSLAIIAQSHQSKDYWLLISDSTNDEFGYINQNHDTVVHFGKYSFCFTDTFRTYAIVENQNLGFVAIDREQNVLYEVFPFDNGPDYISEGLFRIIKDSQIGYADSATGKIVIKPTFNCAYPFENGVAKVSTDCKKRMEGEHSVWISNNWIYIDKKGKRIKAKALRARTDAI